MVCELLARLYLAVHRLVFARRQRISRHFPEHRIISVGNLSAGGTGKTPVTIELALAAMQQGRSVLVALRGYGGKDRSGLLVADRGGIGVSAEESGDEAVLIARRLLEFAERHDRAEFRVAAGPDRIALIERFGSSMDVVLLDDAFQNPSVKRDLDIVLLDSMIPLKRLRLLPCGRFREDLQALERADVVLLTRSNLALDQADEYRKEIQNRYPDLPIYRTGIRTARIVSVDGSEPPKSMAAFCGIGNPESFFRVLEQCGIHVTERFVFRDHHPFTDKDLAMLRNCGHPLVTTEKDAARLGKRLSLLGSVYLVQAEVYEMDQEGESLWHRCINEKENSFSRKET